MYLKRNTLLTVVLLDPGISEAMEEMVQEKYAKTIVEEKLVPVVEPKLEIVSANDEGFEVNMTFILDPEVKLGKYKDLKVKKDKVKVTKEEVKILAEKGNKDEL